MRSLAHTHPDIYTPSPFPQQVASVMDFKLKKKLLQHDVSLVVISLGSASQASEWLKVTGDDGELYVDKQTGERRNTGLRRVFGRKGAQAGDKGALY